MRVVGCAQCGKRFEAKRSTAKYCSSSCRANKAMGIPAVVGRSAPDSSDSGEVAPTVVVVLSESDLVKRLWDELRSLGVDDTSEAAAAIALAEMAVNPELPASARVSAHKELRAAKDLAFRSAAKIDQMDEVTRRRDEKLRSARGA